LPISASFAVLSAFFILIIVLFAADCQHSSAECRDAGGEYFCVFTLIHVFTLPVKTTVSVKIQGAKTTICVHPSWATVKAGVEAIYSKYGMSITDAINVFLYQSRNVGGLPFDLRPSIPNAKTIAAMKEADLITNDPSAKRYADFSEILTEVQDENGISVPFRKAPRCACVAKTHSNTAYPRLSRILGCIALDAASAMTRFMIQLHKHGTTLTDA